MAELSTKPYLIRAIYEWCADCGFTPYIGVNVDQNTRVPLEYVKKGQIVLSISMQATRDLTIGNDLIQFSARFGGVSREINVPIYAVASIFARENGQGMHFERELAPLATVPNVLGVPGVSGTPEGSPMLVLQPSVTSAAQPQLQSVPGSLDAAAQVNEAASDSSSNGQSTKRNEAASAETSADDKPKGPPRGKLRIIK